MYESVVTVKSLCAWLLWNSKVTSSLFTLKYLRSSFIHFSSIHSVLGGLRSSVAVQSLASHVNDLLYMCLPFSCIYSRIRGVVEDRRKCCSDKELKYFTLATDRFALHITKLPRILCVRKKPHRLQRLICFSFSYFRCFLFHFLDFYSSFTRLIFSCSLPIAFLSLTFFFLFIFLLFLLSIVIFFYLSLPFLIFFLFILLFHIYSYFFSACLLYSYSSLWYFFFHTLYFSSYSFWSLLQLTFTLLLIFRLSALLKHLYSLSLLN